MGSFPGGQRPALRQHLKVLSRPGSQGLSSFPDSAYQIHFGHPNGGGLYLRKPYTWALGQWGAFYHPE